MMAIVATREAYGKALATFGKENEKVVVLDADLSKSTKTADFEKVCPERHLNLGISEADMMATAAGLATCGKIPFASTFAMFAAGRGYEQIRNSIGYPHLNVKVAATHAGLSVGEDGASHQCIEDLALMRAIPGMTVLQPADGVETMAMIQAAIETEGPMYIRLGRLGVQTVFDEQNYKFEIGKGIVVEEGTDLTIFATGLMLQEAIKAKQLLLEKNINARVVNIHTIKPIDKELIIQCAKETGAILTSEEHNILGGLGSAVAEVLVENYPIPMLRHGVEDKFGKSGKPADVLSEYGLTAEGIVKKAEQLLMLKKA